MGNGQGKEVSVIEEGEKGAALPMMSTAPPLVKLGNPKRRWEENPVPPIRLEDAVPPEEREHQPSSVSGDTTSSSQANLWQVYALGMFLVSRWVWGRWKERNDRGSADSSTGR